MSKRVLITGANTGIGKATATALAHQGMQIILACKNPERAQAARDEIVRETGNRAVDIAIVDLSSLQSVRTFAEDIHSRYDHLDVLINNAGISLIDRTLSVDGNEMIFAVNHLGPFLLTNLLLDLLLAAEAARIVNVASSVHKNARFDITDLQHERTWSGRNAYGCSKFMNVLFTYELARKLKDSKVTANCLCPGLVRSDFFRAYKKLPFMLKVVMKFVGRTPEEGARTSIYLASSDEVEGVSGRYFQNGKPVESSAGTYDPDLSANLWEQSARLVDPSGELALVDRSALA